MKTDVTITALSTSAEGIAREDGKVMFVPFTLPGETWEVEVVESKKKYSRSVPLTLMHENDSQPVQRVEAPCPVYTQCGGCQMQHIEYAQQLELKQQWLQETFQRIGHLDVNVKPVISANQWEYRNKAVFSLIHNSGSIALAFHAANNPNRFIPVQDCMICDPVIRKAISVFHDGINQTAIKIYPYKNATLSGSKLILRVMDQNLFYAWERVQLHKTDEKKFHSFLQENMPGVKVKKRVADTFAQVNNPVREQLYRYVCEIPFHSHGKLLDGYCGMGELTYQLSQGFEQTDGVEINRQSISAAKKAYPQTYLNFYAQPLETFLASSQQQYNAVIFNPPRAGLSPHVRESMTLHAPKDIVMISCHPAALARDSEHFVNQGYSISSIQPFDMFPQTYHLETVVHYKLR